MLLVSFLGARIALAEVELPVGDATQGITIRGDQARTWQQGSYEVWHVRGMAEIKQGDVVARGPEGVFWIDRSETFSGQPSKVIAYLEGTKNAPARVDFGSRQNPHALSGQKQNSVLDRTWLGRFQTTAGIQVAAPVTGSGQPEVSPAIFERGLDARKPGTPAPAPVRPAQFTGEEVAPPAASTPARPTNKRVRFFPRGHGRWQAKSFEDKGTGEQITLVTAGVQIVVEGIDQLGNATLEADNIVAWTPVIDLSRPTEREVREGERPYEVYLEGNIVFRQGDRVIYAERMYYNVTQEYGVVLAAEMLTPVPSYQGLLRMRAEVLRQVDRQHFEAYGAALTSSRIGVPRYWFQSETVRVEDIQRPIVDPFSQEALVDPATGEPQVDHQMLADARNNFIYVGGVPVFYWPVIATDLTKPTYYLDRITYRSDRILGQQILLDWDAYQLLGIRNKPPGTKFGISTDLLSERGIGLGTNFSYDAAQFLGVPGETHGFFDAWAIPHDYGQDNLGYDRREVPLEAEFRGRALSNHRQIFPGGWQLSVESGIISDRNFLEQYFEREWDLLKDATTGFEAKRIVDNMSFSLSGDIRQNDFFMQTERLPRLDYFIFGQPFAFDRLTFHSHSFATYDRLRAASTPTNPVDLAKFSPLPAEVTQEGMRAVSRNEIDLPVELGPVKVVPYLLGEVGYWGNDLQGEEVTRMYGQGGIRASMPIWKADPNINSELFNLKGLTHKIVLEADAFYADASEDLSRFPRYDSLDDDSTEHFRRRMPVNTFGQVVGTAVPLKYDDRYFALRNNLQGSVASPATEIADDLCEIRLGMRQRWQTKRGLPGQERLVDWITMDTDLVLFPMPGRDNFGGNVGLVDYDFAWHVGDRMTILSDGFYDFYDQGLRQVTAGTLLSRPEHGNIYVGFRSTEGPISSNVLVTSLSYRMSEKWIATGGTSVDFSSTGNIGQNISLVRVGESFLVSIGFNLDASRNNVGVQFGIEPRFLPGSRLGRVGGIQVPPAGALGLE